MIARIFLGLSVYCGWVVSPIYSIISFRSTKRLPQISQPNIVCLSATELAEKIRKQKLTSEQVVKAFIERCREVNIYLNAVVEDRFAAALEDAKKVDQFIRSGEKSIEQIEIETPLLGVPLTIKEACKCADLSFSLGSSLRKGIKAPNDGEAVANLRRAGAIPLCVTNTPELCASIETYNLVTGYTLNPYDMNRTCGGSSGGEAALISAAASPLGIGSDFAGSIRVPCLFCGLFGHKPTPGIVSNEGHLPNLADKEFQKLLNIGPITRSARDLKLALKIMAGDNAAVLDLDKQVKLNELNIFYMLDKGRTFSEISVESEIKKSIKLAVKHFSTTHGCKTEKIVLTELGDSLELCILQTAEIENLKASLCLKNSEEESSCLVELLKALVHISDYSVQTTFMRCLVESLLFIPSYKRFKYAAERNQLSTKLKEYLGTNGVLLFPTYAAPAFYKYELLWKISAVAYPMIPNILGFPATHVPTGLNKKGLPIGFQVIAAPKQDRLCLAVAEELEKVFGGWVAPPCQ